MKLSDFLNKLEEEVGEQSSGKKVVINLGDLDDNQFDPDVWGDGYNDIIAPQSNLFTKNEGEPEQEDGKGDDVHAVFYVDPNQVQKAKEVIKQWAEYIQNAAEEGKGQQPKFVEG